MLIGCGSLSSWVRRLVACVGTDVYHALEYGYGDLRRLPKPKKMPFMDIVNKYVQSRNCFGCAKSTPVTAVDEPSKGLKIQGRSIKHRSLSEDFWSTSPHEMENSALQSQRSMSSISTAAQSSDQHGAGSSSNPNEFVNQGLLLWNQTRQQWVGNRRVNNSQRQQTREPKIGWNATYESLLGSTKAFAQPIPLGEMVDFLVDGWEQEGLYD